MGYLVIMVQYQEAVWHILVILETPRAAVAAPVLEAAAL
jgi:hypothetical protein